MKKRWKYTALAAVLCASLLLMSACGLTNQDRYEQAQLYLGCRDYESARLLFHELGEFDDAGDYALYCAGLIALAEGDYARASADFANLGEFKRSALYLSYLDALLLEQEGELEGAMGLFDSLGSFEDSAEKAAHLRQLIPQRDYAAAQSLMAAGQYEQAWHAFDALGDYQDSALQAAACQTALFEAFWNSCQQSFSAGAYEETLQRLHETPVLLTQAMADQLTQLAESCRAALYDRARRSEDRGFAAAEETLALYDALGTYGDSRQRAEALRAQYEAGLQIHDFNGEWQYVSLGAWPENAPLLWRVVKCYDQQVLLLADTIVDVRPLCAEDEVFTTYEASGLHTWLCDTFAVEAFTSDQQKALCGETPVFLLSKEEAALLPEAAHRKTGGTDHAVEQGLRLSTDQTGWWWLRDQGELHGCQSIVYFNGEIYAKGVQAHDMQTGVRPALWLDLECFPLKEGAGTREDPFR